MTFAAPSLELPGAYIDDLLRDSGLMHRRTLCHAGQSLYRCPCGRLNESRPLNGVGDVAGALRAPKDRSASDLSEPDRPVLANLP